MKRYKLPKLTLEKIDNSNEFEFVVKYLSTKNTSGPNGFTSEFYQKPKEESY